MIYTPMPFPEAVPLPEHFHVEAVMGCKPVLHCPCGASVTFSKTVRNVPGRELRDWLDVHRECKGTADEQS